MTSLGDLGDFRNGVNFSRSDYGPGFPIVNVKQLYGGRYIETRDLLQVLPSAIANPESVWLQYGDILFARSSVKASGAGQVAMVGPCPTDAVFSGFIIRFRVRDKRRASPEYLNYLLRSPMFRELLTRIASGTTITNLSQETLASLPIKLPPYPEQASIAHLLGTLDDKIELNRRMNETLEAMARAIFKSWFVEFDPVRAKAEGRQPFGMDAATAALFPDSFQDSPLGKIPKEWTVRTLDTLAVLNPETWTKETAPPQVSYVDLSNVKWGSIESTAEYAWGEAPSRAQRILRPGDTIVGTVRPANGSYALVSDEGLTGSTGFAVLRPRKSEFRGVVYFGATAPDNIERLAHLADGAAYPAVRPHVIASTHLVTGPDAVLNCFSSAARPLLDKIAANHRESRSLAAIRDTLLPKLISGEVRVPLSQRTTEAASL